MASDLATRIHRVIAAIAEGDVASYGEVAALAGRPDAARAVGMVLARSDGLPWWRVVNAQGRLVPGHEVEQARRLRGEGVAIRSNRVVAFDQPGSARSPRSDRVTPLRPPLP